jgi:hypothetical protein
MLADFRVAHRRPLDELLTRILASLLSAGLVSLHRVAQDGMRVRASAGAASFRGKAGLDNALAQARSQVRRVGHAINAPDMELTRRQRTASERAARERLARIEEAIALLPEVDTVKQRQKYTARSATARPGE